MLVKLDGIKAYVKGGRVYAYDRMSGKPLNNKPRKVHGEWHGDEKLILELATLRAAIPKDGTVLALITAYKKHDVSVKKRKAYPALAERTRRDYDQDLDRLCRAKLDGNPIRDMRPDEITMDDCRGLRDAWNGTYGSTQTKRIMAACSVLWSYGVEYSWVTSNLWKALPAPAAQLSGKQPNPPWTAFEVLAMIDSAPHIGLARAYALGFCGVRPENIPSITLRQLRDEISAQKTGKKHHITVPDEIAFLFESDLTSIMASNQANGTPWKTYGQLRRQFDRHRDKLSREGIVRPEITMKGLNHTLGSALSETGATSKEMQAAMARSAQTVEHYSRRANQKILSEAAFTRLSGWFSLSTEGKDVSTNHHGKTK